VSVQRIVAGAGTARSTFYEHFGGKEDILRASMAPFFATFADCVLSECQPDNLAKVLEHMWGNRRLTDAIFTGASRAILARNLSEMVETRLRELHAGAPLTLPYRLAAIMIADAQMTLVESWLRGRAYARQADVGFALHDGSRALAKALARTGVGPNGSAS
jgi:AcrR family transcriptional regulator